MSHTPLPPSLLSGRPGAHPGAPPGTAVAQALTHSRYAFASHTTPAELLDAWYTVKVMTTGTLAGVPPPSPTPAVQLPS